MQILVKKGLRVLLYCLLWAGAACNRQPGSKADNTSLMAQKQPLPGHTVFYQLNTAQYIPMHDGIRIAVELYLPVAANRGRQVPAAVEFTRYWRNSQMQSGFSDNSTLFTQHGYAHVRADVRGSGASEGVWNLYAEDERKDYYEIIDWIVHQPWSDGSVGLFGASYLGGSALFAAASGHPAVKAVSPLFFSPDLYNAIFFPGGVFNRGFTALWDQMCTLADLGDPAYGIPGDPDKEYLYRSMLKGIKPVDEDKEGIILNRILTERKGNNLGILNAFSGITFKDDPVITENGSFTLETASPAAALTAINDRQIPVLIWEGWYDAGNAQAALLAYNRLTGPRQLVIGPWGHGTRHHVSPYLPPETASDTTYEEIYGDVVRFFDYFLRQEPGNTQWQDTVRYYTFGEEKWHTTGTWPPAGIEYRNWYLAPEHRLLPAAPTVRNTFDTYRADFQAASGAFNRHILRYTDIVYAERATEDQRLITYTSLPLAENMLLTGTAVITLYIASSHKDGALFVYLEEVTPEGKVLYLTEGILRLIHRKTASPNPALDTGGRIYRSFAAKDNAPLVPGEIAEITFPLNAISTLVKKGHSIRIAIAGHDNSVFKRIPDKGNPVLQIQRNKVYPSHIQLPVTAQKTIS